jgi:hypothetical protein
VRHECLRHLVKRAIQSGCEQNQQTASGAEASPGFIRRTEQDGEAKKGSCMLQLVERLLSPRHADGDVRQDEHQRPISGRQA